MREMLDKLNLGPLFGFFPANPITMMQVYAPEISAIRAYPVVESSHSVFVVIATHRCTVLPSLQIGSQIALADRISYPAAEHEIQALRIGRILRRRPNWCTICASKYAHCATATYDGRFLIEIKGLIFASVWKTACSHLLRKEWFYE